MLLKAYIVNSDLIYQEIHVLSDDLESYFITAREGDTLFFTVNGTVFLHLTSFYPLDSLEYTLALKVG